MILETLSEAIYIRAVRKRKGDDNPSRGEMCCMRSHMIMDGVLMGRDYVILCSKHNRCSECCFEDKICKQGFRSVDKKRVTNTLPSEQGSYCMSSFGKRIKGRRDIHYLDLSI